MESNTDVTFSTLIESKEEILHDEFTISSKSLGLFSVELYRSLEGQILGGLISKSEVFESHRIIDLDSTLKIDLIQKIIKLRILGNNNDVNPEAHVSYLQMSQIGRQITTSKEEKIKDAICFPTGLSLGNLKTLDTHSLGSSLINIIKYFNENSP